MYCTGIYPFISSSTIYCISHSLHLREVGWSLSFQRSMLVPTQGLEYLGSCLSRPLQQNVGVGLWDSLDPLIFIVPTLYNLVWWKAPMRWEMSRLLLPLNISH